MNPQIKKEEKNISTKNTELSVEDALSNKNESLKDLEA